MGVGGGQADPLAIAAQPAAESWARQARPPYPSIVSAPEVPRKQQRNHTALRSLSLLMRPG